MPSMETADKVTIHYGDEGSGFPLVFVHGWAMSGKVWAFQKPLADRFRLITLDLRGHGKSSAAPGYAFGDFAADLVALFDRLGIERAGLVGWSLGAQVALEAVPLLGNRVAALVLVAGTPKFTAADGWPHGLPAHEARGLGLRLKRAYDATLGDFFRQMFAEGELSHDQYQRIVREIVIPRPLPDPEAVQACLATLAGGDHRNLLPAIAAPTLVIHGDRDAICPPGAGRYLAEGIPGARFLSLEGTGHAPFLSRSELFNRELSRFLAEVSDRD
ncbi:alpha/beta fold hydrolase [Geobacter hydrogenophilus]|uniref:O-methylpimelyl-ACP methylesterase n=1 Tax=Geobacter hydrogenophilus TaxID=40983 RepID=A0A9W6LDU0_9BACT|nr:alpha/beta fold hydrolase [Geobacter hydrogenophilus]MBT0892650.1 alpha/beta fold hydrolase [Geobacter hydrogenophilus]GLI40048.1 O-methylpimelyl-ACP methylesterase [Geobacter hydrogenophilus]